MNFNEYKVEDFVADELFIRWVNGDDSLNSFWETWIKENPGKQELFAEATSIIKAVAFPSFSDTQARVDAVWDKIVYTHHQSNPSFGKQLSESKSIASGKRSGWLLRVASVSIGLLVVISSLLFFTDVFSFNQSYQTDYGEIREITLPDGSVVTLNANSKLTFSEFWSNEDREVWLEGEGFFSVSKKLKMSSGARAKFVVHTDELDVRVLGTHFNVNTRSQQTIVVLNEGKISLDIKAKDTTCFMNPGDIVQVNARENRILQKKVNVELYTAWTNNEWILEDWTLTEVSEKIKETYGIDVIINDSIKSDVKVSGVIPTDDLDNLLNALSPTFDVRITRHRNQIFIDPSE